jgi:hypothetical protein
LHDNITLIMVPFVKQAKLPGLITRLFVVVLAINDVFHFIQAFTFLPSPKRVLPPSSHHLLTPLPSAVRHGKTFRVILSSTLDVPEGENQDNDLVVDNNTLLSVTQWSQIESLHVETLQSEKIKLGDVIMSASGGRGTVVLSCLSHYGDYNAWEVTQQYMSAINSGRLSESW